MEYMGKIAEGFLNEAGAQILTVLLLAFGSLLGLHRWQQGGKTRLPDSSKMLHTSREEITLQLSRDGHIEEFFCNEANQKQVLQDIYRHTLEGAVSLDKVIQEHLVMEIEKRPPLKECENWWAQIPQGFRLNTVGYVLGYAYGKQLFEDLPDWI